MNKRFKYKITRLLTSYNRNLLLELVYADFKTYDRNSLLGTLWSLLNPAITLLILYCVFDKRFGHFIPFYPLYILIGVVTVNFFINVTTKMIASIAVNRNIVLNSTIPREDFILADLLVNTFKFLIELSLCWILSIYFGVFAWQSIFLSIPLIIAYVALALSAGLLLSLLYCFAMDIDHMWRIASRLFLFITPVFYSLQHISHLFSVIIYWGNPLTPFLISFREIFIWQNTLNISNYLFSISIGFILLIISYSIFILFENMAIEQV